MSLNITEPRALQVLSRIEGTDWRFQQEADRNDPWGLFAVGAAWLRSRPGNTRLSAAEIMPEGGLVHGRLRENGFRNVYTVRPDGEVVMIITADEESDTLACRFGVSVENA
jgi:hypothetical protein